MKLIWNYIDLQKWIEEGCDNEIALKVIKLSINDNNIIYLPKEIGFLINLYSFECSNNQIKELIHEIGNLIHLERFDCSNNILTELIPEIGNLINLHYFYCNNNNINKLLPEIGNLIHLKIFSCENNNLTKLIPEIGNLRNLGVFNCSKNKLTELIPELGNLIHLKNFRCNNNNLTELIHEIVNLINLNYFYCSNNKIISLIPEIGNLINLNSFECRNNQIKELIPEICNLPYLVRLDCSNNQIEELIPEICNLNNLQQFFYSNNPIEYINPQLLRFINRRRNIQKIYNDSQSVHNHQIQEGISNSIKYIMSIKPTFSKDELKLLIINNQVLTLETKNILIEYCDNTDIHSLLNITFEELLLNIYSLCLINEHRDEIFQIMNAEMNDSLCKCFTGRISRLVNCLNGFDGKIKINISDNEQIGNIIILIKDQLITENKYDLETHKNLVKINLLDKGYELNIIEEWLGYCE